MSGEKRSAELAREELEQVIGGRKLRRVAGSEPMRPAPVPPVVCVEPLPLGGEWWDGEGGTGEPSGCRGGSQQL